MRVDNKSPYRLIFSVNKHPQLGLIVEPYIVALTYNFNLSLNFQKVTSLNVGHFDQVSSEQAELVKNLDFLIGDNIVKSFSPVKKIRPQEYFKKHWKKSVQEQIIRPYIEENLNIFFNKLIQTPNVHVFLADELNPAHNPIHIEPKTATVLFHFRRDAVNTNYFATIKADNKKVFIEKNSLIITQKPCWMISDKKLIHFNEQVEGNKLSPFIKKKFISVSREQENKFFKVFGVKLMEQFAVYSEGLDISEEKQQAQLVLDLQSNGADQYFYRIKIKYDKHIFNYSHNKNYYVVYKYQEGKPKFIKIKRSFQWEENQINKLVDRGLTVHINGILKCGNGSLSSIRNWLYFNKDWLDENNFLLHYPKNLPISYEDYKLSYVVKDKIDWFDVEIWVEIGEIRFPFKKLTKYLENGENKFPLPNGKIFIIPEEWFSTFQKLSSISKTDKTYKIQKYQTELLNIIQSDKIKKHLRKIKKPQNHIPAPTFRGELRPYQLQGLSWIMFLYENNFGGILADDMGLGKTVQTLSFVQLAKNLRIKENKLSLFDSENKCITSLLVAPTSLLYNWYNEAEKFTPDLKVLVHSGYQRTSNAEDFKQYDLVITSYGLVRNDFDIFNELHFQSIILDESQNIKNPRAKSTQLLKKLHSNHRLALTGTPIENTLKDLWSQMQFLNKGLLETEKKFDAYFLKPIEKEGDEKREKELKRRIEPFILRRTKNEVAKDLPTLTEKIVFCDMLEDQKSLYEEIKSTYRNELLNTISKEGIKKNKLNILQGLTKLRQIANHPALIEQGANLSSGKHDIILEHIKTAINEGHKVLVFSQFVSYLDILSKDLTNEKIDFYSIVGATRIEDRQRQIKVFQTENGHRVFLISLKAASTGLTLTEADYVFIVDPWWNPFAEQQARDRTHRIGQTKKVFSYRFISRETVEEKIVQLQKRKTKLSENLIQLDTNILEKFDENYFNLFFE